MDNSTPILEQAQRRIGAAGKKGAIVRRVRGKIVWVERAVAIAMGLFRSGDRIGLGGRIHARHNETDNSTKRSMYVVALVVLLLSVGVGGSLGRATSTAEVRIPPTESIVSTAALSPEPNADEGSNDMATVTLRARYKGH